MAITRIAPSRATRALNLLRTINSTHSACPCHSNPGHNHHIQNPFAGRTRSLATPADFSQQKEYAFEMAASSIRFGPGCTKEVGMDFRHLGAKKVLVVTDSTVLKLDAMKQVVEGLEREGIPYEVYSNTRVEPKDYS
jgi:hydroxyacid-oxoacid transhydrogenase